MSSGGGRLQHALKRLREHWDETKQQWSDQVSREFEQKHLIPLEQQTTSTVHGMGKIAEVIAKVRQECS